MSAVQLRPWPLRLREVSRRRLATLGPCVTESVTAHPGNPLHGLAQVARREVRVAHCHGDGLVTHEFLHRAQVTPRHRESRGEGVAEVMPPEVDDAGSPGDQRAIVALRKYLATRLGLPDSLVFFHFDGDVTWATRTASINREQFNRRVVQPVETLLAGIIGQSAAAVRMRRLIEVVPFYSIETWTYQNTSVLVGICSRHCGAIASKHAKLYRSWASAPTLLDEVAKPKDVCCVANRCNLELVDNHFPWTRLSAAGKSFAAVVADAQQREEVASPAGAPPPPAPRRPAPGGGSGSHRGEAGDSPGDN